ncbi:MAG: LytTR family DNA-binding domain-containing protein [Bacteroidota bacterium]
MEKTIRYIQIDDSFLDQAMLLEFAGKYPQLEHAGSFNHPLEAFSSIEGIAPNLIFLDIEMPGISGLEMQKTLRDTIPMTVFITSHAEFALDGFELSALDYIMKPLDEKRFAICMQRVINFWEMKQKAIAYNVYIESDLLTIKDGHTQIKLPQQEIIYLEAMQDYTKVVTSNKYYLTLTSLSSFLDKLQPGRFLRVHRSYAVAIDKISQYTSSNIICGQASLPVGKTFRHSIAKMLA